MLGTQQRSNQSLQHALTYGYWLQRNTHTPDGSLLSLPSLLLDSLYSLIPIWTSHMVFHNSLLGTKDSTGNFKQEAASWFGITQRGQDITEMRDG